MFRKIRGRSTIVNLTNGESFQGVVDGVGLFSLRLVSVELLEPERNPMAGAIVIPRRMIRWVQVL